MKKDELFDIWNSGNDSLFHEQKIDKAMIEKSLSGKTKKTTRYFNFNIIFYASIQLVNIALLSINLMGYKNNMAIFWTLIILLALSVGFLVFGIDLYYKFRETNKFSDSLINLINKQLHLINVSYEVWMLIVAFSSLILIFNASIIVDYNNGYYPINHVNVFVITLIAVFLFIYFTQKVASSFLTKSLKANLNDLRNGILDETNRIERKRKKFKWIGYILVIILIFILILGILKSINFG